MLGNIFPMFYQYIQSIYEAIVTNDSNGAAIFIIVVLLWYSSSVVFLLGMQMRKSTEIHENSGNLSSKLFAQNFHDPTNNKDILEQLVNKQNRDKLWNIYFDKSKDMRDKISRDDTARILNIEKQLSILSESQSNQYNDFTQSNTDEGSSDIDSTILNSRLRPRRRPSLDYQILQEWKILAKESKINENWPWAIQRLMIRRRFRRPRCVSE